MRFTCNTKELDTACQNLSRILPTKTSTPILEGILLNAENGMVSLTAYNLETGLATSISATVEEEGSLVLNGKILTSLVHGMPNNTLSVSKTEGRLTCKITSGLAKFQIQGMDSSDYPELPKVDEGTTLSLRNGQLKDLMNDTEYAVSSSEIPKVNNGIRLDYSHDSVSMTATDGFRFATGTVHATQDVSGAQSAVLPVQAVREAVKLVEQKDEDTEESVSLILNDRHLMTTIGKYTLISRLMNGEFPNLDMVRTMPTNTTMTVDRKAWIQSIERVSLVAQNRLETPLRCTFSKESQTMNLSVSSPLGEASDELSVTLDGAKADCTIGLNYKYVLDALKACPDTTLKVRMNGSLHPVFIEPVETDEDKVAYLHVLCPVRLRDTSN